jgi:hypothetical protein
MILSPQVRHIYVLLFIHGFGLYADRSSLSWLNHSNMALSSSLYVEGFIDFLVNKAHVESELLRHLIIFSLLLLKS